MKINDHLTGGLQKEGESNAQIKEVCTLSRLGNLQARNHPFPQGISQQQKIRRRPRHYFRGGIMTGFLKGRGVRQYCDLCDLQNLLVTHSKRGTRGSLVCSRDYVKKKLSSGSYGKERERNVEEVEGKSFPTLHVCRTRFYKGRTWTRGKEN